MFIKIKEHFNIFGIFYTFAVIVLLTIVLSISLLRDIKNDIENGDTVKNVTEFILDIKDKVDETINEYESEEN